RAPRTRTVLVVNPLSVVVRSAISNPDRAVTARILGPVTVNRIPPSPALGVVSVRVSVTSAGVGFRVSDGESPPPHATTAAIAPTIAARPVPSRIARTIRITESSASFVQRTQLVGRP